MVNETPSGEPIQIPKWDVALESLLKEEYLKLGRPLYLRDFQRLAQHYAIRLDDIMVTLFELCIHGLWDYRDSENSSQEITRELLENMTAGGRLKDEDLKNFSGGWVARG
jgi:hypothetical protein